MAQNTKVKFIEASVGIQHNIDELLVGVLKQIRFKREKSVESPNNINDISPSSKNKRVENTLSQFELLKANGYTQEDESFLMNPMTHTGVEATGSMGTDTPISALSNKSKLLYTYFKQMKKYV